MRLANLKLKVSICRILQREVKFLGHVVPENCLKIDSAKMEAVASWPEPQNLKDIRSFAELCEWYCEFVPDFATLPAPLNILTR